MKTNRLSYIQNILVPCLVFSAAAGVFTGILIFLFKAAVSWVAAHSETVYEAVHTNPVRIPVLIAGMALVGWLAAVILNYAPEAREPGAEESRQRSPSSAALFRFTGSRVSCPCLAPR